MANDRTVTGQLIMTGVKLTGRTSLPCRRGLRHYIMDMPVQSGQSLYVLKDRTARTEHPGQDILDRVA